MPRRKPIPTVWLMTDERMGEALWPALRSLPPGAGIVLRHHATSPADRRRLIRRVYRLAIARRLLLSVAGHSPGPWARHNPSHRAPGLSTAAAHDRREAVRAVGRGASILFVSPVFATRSHPHADPIGTGKAAAITRGFEVSTIALGGMNRRRFLRIRNSGFDGWAAIDALVPRQKRNAVPT